MIGKLREDVRHGGNADLELGTERQHLKRQIAHASQRTERAQALRKPGYVSEERVTTLAADSRVARSQVSRAWSE